MSETTKDNIYNLLIAEIDMAELTCRIIEAAGCIKRPPGMTAFATMHYWKECIEKANRVN